MRLIVEQELVEITRVSRNMNCNVIAYLNGLEITCVILCG